MQTILQTTYRPQEDAHCQWKAVYKYFNIVLDGLQGLIVSVAFCYRNGEVRNYSSSTTKARLIKVDRITTNLCQTGWLLQLSVLCVP